ncbi:tissue factor pathway inhibitor 2 isoform X2 [Boleophthalmus pectinirostris]|uniref:tissue factor pathway inhibitor 2 isoform X2 n=1 Tax=Boleophthalmus pectinirostris TaxID=150288 RepID=UPI000A1C587A|nr:tissue factor pathway inhibitor 2 isoform X2 [Boleophthalmus pectinirostris]
MQRWIQVSISVLCALGSVRPLRHKAVALCLLPAEEGPCRANIQRFYYNTQTQKCEHFYYGGCQGNANNFRTYQECHKTCFRIPRVPAPCRLPQEPGPCRSLLSRYFFNMSSLQCEPFYYGGCHGNANRFLHLTSCSDLCSPTRDVPVLCRDPLDKGTCSASIPRFYYDARSRSCLQFLYSGCGGSSNNFVSRDSCMDVCAPAKVTKST